MVQSNNRKTKLICTTVEYAELWEEVMKSKWTIKSGVTDECERNKLRAELDGIIGHVYELTDEEFKYILSTFPIVPQEQKDLTLKCFLDISKGILKHNNFT